MKYKKNEDDIQYLVVQGVSGVLGCYTTFHTRVK